MCGVWNIFKHRLIISLKTHTFLRMFFFSVRSVIIWFRLLFHLHFYVHRTSLRACLCYTMLLTTIVLIFSNTSVWFSFYSHSIENGIQKKRMRKRNRKKMLFCLTHIPWATIKEHKQIKHRTILPAYNISLYVFFLSLARLEVSLSIVSSHLWSIMTKVENIATVYVCCYLFSFTKNLSHSINFVVCYAVIQLKWTKVSFLHFVE